MSLPPRYEWVYSVKIKVLLWDVPSSSPLCLVSPHCGGCHSSVLPNKLAEGEGGKKKEEGTQGGNIIEGEMEDRDRREGTSRAQ